MPGVNSTVSYSTTPVVVVAAVVDGCLTVANCLGLASIVNVLLRLMECWLLKATPFTSLVES